MPPRKSTNGSAASQQTEATAAVNENDTHPASQVGSTIATGPDGSAGRVNATHQPLAPSASSSQSRPARPGARPRGVGRRSQQGRAELERVELERKQVEAANQVQAKAWQRRDAPRGRGSTRGRTRGGYAGEGVVRSDDTSIASGPFSLGQVNKDTGRRGHGAVRESGGGLGGGASSSTGKTASSSSRSKSNLPDSSDFRYDDIKMEDAGYISSDADDERATFRKVNVDQLVDLTVDDEDAGNNAVSLPPIRIQRHEHKGRAAGATADSTLANAGDTDAFAPERRRARHRASTKSPSLRYKGTYTDSSSENEVQVKQEHAVPHVQSPPTSPEIKRKSKASIRKDSFGNDAPGFQSKEEETEWLLQQHDLRVLQDELGHVSLMTADGKDENARADKMYLFQFPAVLPTLAPVHPKQEDGDIDMQAIPEADSSAKAAATTPASTATGGLPSGMVGKLRVHKSGRAYLDWGGIPMELSMGQEASFLQDVVVMDAPEIKPSEQAEESEPAEGTVMSMGQVKGRFVIVPQWDAFFDHAY